MDTVIIVVLIGLLLVSVFYQMMPYRALPNAPEKFTIMPKYQARCASQISDQEIDGYLQSLGFQQVSREGSRVRYVRGKLLGDISIRLLRIHVEVERITASEVIVKLKAGWLVIFDTGDHAKFLTALVEHMRSNETVT
ncbi:MAG: hypothetical protein HWE11_09795 [Gammaproteobacteria bacterium]|nr:hypothetical protein [Gammaproteobacteria bacterium]